MSSQVGRLGRIPPALKRDVIQAYQAHPDWSLQRIAYAFELGYSTVQRITKPYRTPRHVPRGRQKREPLPYVPTFQTWDVPDYELEPDWLGNLHPRRVA